MLAIYIAHCSNNCQEYSLKVSSIVHGRGNNAIIETMFTHKNIMVDNYNTMTWTIKSTDSKALGEAKRNSQSSWTLRKLDSGGNWDRVWSGKIWRNITNRMKEFQHVFWGVHCKGSSFQVLFLAGPHLFFKSMPRLLWPPTRLSFLHNSLPVWHVNKHIPW